MKKSNTAGKILTILFTAVITLILVLAGEYLILGKDTVKLAAISLIMQRNFHGDVIPDNEYKALLASLDDPYSRYFTEDEYRKYYIDNNKYVGIGITVVFSETEPIVTVNSVNDGSPAEDAGILAGDIIYGADGVVFDETNYTNAADYIRGEENTVVSLDIVREGEHITVDVTRRNIVTPCASGYMFDESIGIINLTSFSANSSDDFKKTFNELCSLGMTKMIINLDNNGGGMLNEAIGISDIFLPKDSLVTYMTDKNGNRRDYHTSDDDECNLPTVILVNKNSASASEMFSGAMQYYKKAVLIGETTYGKGVAQSIIPLPDNTALSVTNAKYYLPSDICIHGTGLTPDYEVPMDDGGKSQFEKAVEILRKG